MDSDIIAFESLQAAKEAANWAFWAMAGTWFAGIATFAAVFVSLRLSRATTKVKLKCNVAERVIITALTNGTTRQEPGIAFQITNLSISPVKITNVGWSAGKGKYWMQQFGDVNSERLPKKLDYGEEVLFWVSLDEGEEPENEWFRKIAIQFKKKAAVINKVRCAVTTSTGGTINFKVDKKLLEKIELYMNESN